MEAIYPKIKSLEDVLKASKTAAACGLIFTGLLLLGAFLVYFGNSEAVLGEATTDAQVRFVLLSIGIEIGIVLLLSWRVSTGKGYVSAICLLAIFCFEIGSKFLNGGAGTGYIVMYLFIALGMISGVRATLAYNKFSKINAAIETF